MKIKNILYLVLACGILAFLPLRAESQFDFDKNPIVGKQAPNFTLKTLKGNSLSLNEYRNGQPAIIFFWATWCPHCHEEMGGLSSQIDAMQSKGIKIVLVNLDETPSEVQAFVNKYNLPLEVFLDKNSRIADVYGLIGVPTLFFIDKDGVIVSMEHGLPENYAQTFSSHLKKKS